MFSKLNIKLIGLIGGAALMLLLGVFIKITYFSDKCENYMTVGGKQNPCQCTQRIER